MSTPNNIVLNYFKPKKFELFRNGTIYDLVGIKIYKKYLPSTGDLVRKWRNIKQIKIGTFGRLDELYRYERKTRNYELRHIFGAILLIILSLMLDRKLTLFDWIFLPALNLYINIYPIFLQRYNRIRIINLLQSYGYQNPYTST